jgi:integrase
LVLVDEIKPGSKTRNGARPIVLMAVTVAALKDHRRQQLSRRMRLGPEWRDVGFVFDGGDGDHQRPNAVQVAFRKAIERTGLPQLTPHGMRHTMATVMVGEGVHHKVLQERLGHGSAQGTLDRYADVSLATHRRAVESLEAGYAIAPERTVDSA